MAFGGKGGAVVRSLVSSGLVPPVSCPSFPPGTASSPTHTLRLLGLPPNPTLALLSLGPRGWPHVPSSHRTSGSPTPHRMPHSEARRPSSPVPPARPPQHPPQLLAKPHIFSSCSPESDPPPFSDTLPLLPSLSHIETDKDSHTQK